ncbi:helix-turn-helix domain-containing protein [Variovorax ginsengisoli]|uniref:Helix-turn-helix domain-containing protein n=2 Tax=Variovorax guangxiensis TaxID=1775474 RepID=A0A502DPX8_9BURK|nr:helix-turn-helix domain-containing protein [Variovorax ginsengisoli]TPG27437.1 helix-turn-helix domain-containing protein [Variovorax guangxiensis]
MLSATAAGEIPHDASGASPYAPDMAQPICTVSALPSFRDGAAAKDDDSRTYTVPLWCTLFLLAGAMQQGFSQADLLRRMGVPREATDDPQWPVPIEKIGAVLRYVARRMRDELVGLSDRPVPLGTFSCVIQQMLRCSTLGEALSLGIRLYRLVSPGFPVRLRTVQAMAQLEARLPASRADFPFEAVSVCWVLSLARWLTNRPIPVRDAWMSSPAQDARYREKQPFFEVPGRYGCSGTGVAFDAAWLQRPLARSAESLEPFLNMALANLMRSHLSTPGAAEQVRSQLQLQGVTDRFSRTLQSVARTLGVSPRSLRRRLQLEGCSYHDLKDAMRRDLALNWVANSDVSLVEVGDRLGFADASTFHRAFKRWTGAAPGEFRRSQHGSHTADA